MTLILTSTALLVACSGADNKESLANVSVNADGTCTQDFTDSYAAVYNESNRLQERLERNLPTSKIINQALNLKYVCDQFFIKHNQINCKMEVDHQKVKVTSASLVNKCQMAQQILQSSQISDK